MSERNFSLKNIGERWFRIGRKPNPDLELTTADTPELQLTEDPLAAENLTLSGQPDVIQSFEIPLGDVEEGPVTGEEYEAYQNQFKPKDPTVSLASFEPQIDAPVVSVTPSSEVVPAIPDVVTQDKIDELVAQALSGGRRLGSPTSPTQQLAAVQPTITVVAREPLSPLRTSSNVEPVNNQPLSSGPIQAQDPLDNGQSTHTPDNTSAGSEPRKNEDRSAPRPNVGWGNPFASGGAMDERVNSRQRAKKHADFLNTRAAEQQRQQDEANQKRTQTAQTAAGGGAGAGGTGGGTIPPTGGDSRNEGNGLDSRRSDTLRNYEVSTDPKELWNLINQSLVAIRDSDRVGAKDWTREVTITNRQGNEVKLFSIISPNNEYFKPLYELDASYTLGGKLVQRNFVERVKEYITSVQKLTQRHIQDVEVGPDMGNFSQRVMGFTSLDEYLRTIVTPLNISEVGENKIDNDGSTKLTKAFNLYRDMIKGNWYQDVDGNLHVVKNGSVSPDLKKYTLFTGNELSEYDKNLVDKFIIKEIGDEESGGMIQDMAWRMVRIFHMVEDADTKISRSSNIAGSALSVLSHMQRWRRVLLDGTPDDTGTQRHGNPEFKGGPKATKYDGVYLDGIHLTFLENTVVSQKLTGEDRDYTVEELLDKGYNLNDIPWDRLPRGTDTAYKDRLQKECGLYDILTKTDYGIYNRSQEAFQAVNKAVKDVVNDALVMKHELGKVTYDRSLISQTKMEKLTEGWRKLTRFNFVQGLVNESRGSSTQTFLTDNREYENIITLAGDAGTVVRKWGDPLEAAKLHTLFLGHARKRGDRELQELFN